MNEIFIAVIALVSGGFAAWIWRGSLANAKLAPIEQQLAERAGELDALKTEQRRAAEQLRAESERRAAAETRASRIPELESQLTA